MQRCVPGLQPLNPDLTCKSHVTKLNQADQALCTSDAGRHAHKHTPRPAADDAQTTHEVREFRTAVRLARAAAAATPQIFKFD